MTVDAGRFGDHTSAAADLAVAAVGAGTLAISFLEAVDLLVKITVGLLTVVLLIMRIRAHLKDRAALAIERGEE